MSICDTTGLRDAGIHARSAPVEVTHPPVPLWPLTVPFVLTLIMAVLAATYLPYRALAWSLDLIAGHPKVAILTPILVFLAFASFLTGFRWCTLILLSYGALRRRLREPAPTFDRWPLVSILVPAFNESDTIAPALDSLLRLNYPRYEVIVVDDGSTDDTFERARPFEGDYGKCRISVFHKPNGGKWSALNFAFNRSRGDLLLCVDADSKLDPHSVRLMVGRMADPGIAAVAGQIRVRNRTNLLTCLQALEYIMSSGALRMAQSYHETVLVVPGPLGLYRRAVLEAVCRRWGLAGSPTKAGHVYGPLASDTFAEDFDLSLAVLTLGGRIVYEPFAVSHTKAPDWTSALISQRYRWARGTIQVLRKLVRRTRAEPQLIRPKLVAWLALTYGADILLLPLAYCIGAVIMCIFLVSGGGALPILLSATPILLLSFNGALYCVVLHGDRFRLLGTLLVYDFYHGFMLNGTWVIAVLDEMRGVRMRW